MKMTIKFLLVFLILSSFNVGEVNAQGNNCAISGLQNNMTLNFNGDNLETQTIPVSISPSNCYSNLTFIGVPSWATVTAPNSYTSSVITIECQINTTTSQREGTFAAFLNYQFVGSVTIKQSIGCNAIWYPDSDGDGFGDVHSSPTVSCGSPFSGAVKNNLDYCPEYSSTVNNGCEAGYVHEDINWTTSKTYDINETLKSSSKSYFNDLGKSTQSQSLDVKTGKTWATQVMYDTQGRPALQTLSAPIDSIGNLFYKPDFIKTATNNTYQNSDWEGAILNPVGNQANTLGHYYSTANTGEPFQDITNYPLTRSIFSELNPGTVLRVEGGRQTDNNLPHSYTFSMPAGEELSQVGAFNDVNYNTRKVIKTISRNPHGTQIQNVENVIFTDTDGKTLAAARVGGTAERTSTIAIRDQGYLDVHVPVGVTTGFTINLGASGATTEIYNLITEEPVTISSSSLTNGFYRVAIVNLDTYNPSTPVTVTYRENYYDYSLNTYDEAGRLVSSKQPLNHLETTYEYNALGQLLTTTSPDEGIANFVYRNDGQIRFSQNSKQALANEYSYTNYDDLARPEESGVVSGSFSLTMDGDQANNFSGTRREQHFTRYDDVSDPESVTDISMFNALYDNPSFLSGNVARTKNEQTTTYYSYDIYGRVQWIVQKIAGLGVKTINYEYDPVTSQVNQVIYQKEVPAEKFIHRYTYDPVDLSLTNVETSTNGSTYKEHAAYEYYETGALKNVKLAEGIQQIDYIYNLSGQLKAINHPNLDAASDPGNNNANDLFGMSIDYFTDDYKRSTAFNNVTGGNDLFNGNIKGIAWNTDYTLGNAPAQYTYEYNRNNWLTKATFSSADGTNPVEDNITVDYVLNPNATLQATESITLQPGAHVTATTGTSFIAQITDGILGADDYKVHGITYDANGNIQTLNRNKNSQGGSNAMDVLDYNYDTDNGKPNQLIQVIDHAGDVGVQDIGDQTDPNNYEYNTIGQLTSNIADDVAYVYNASGLVTEVNKFSSGNAIVKFYYNDKNHRIKKVSYNTQSGAILSTTHYVRDASGTPLAIYQKPANGAVELKEHTIYGASRLGVHYRQSNSNAYQLTDHLGNVRAVIVESGDNAAAITSKTDYYPFGMPMPYRNEVGNYRYAFQGQEKDPETGKEAFELRLWDSRIGRWLTTDPAGQYASPYLGMGNNPVTRVDPDGGTDGNSSCCPGDCCPDNSFSIGAIPIDRELAQSVGGGLTPIGITPLTVDTSLWNNSFTRFMTGDGISFGISFSGNAVIGADIGGEFTWIFRGPDASFIPVFEFGPAVSVSDGGQVTWNIWGSKKWHAGSVNEIRATDLGGYSVFADVGFTPGIGGSLGGDIAGNFENGKFKPTWISATITGSIGAEASPLTGVQIEAGVRHNSLLIHNNGNDFTIFNPITNDIGYHYSLDK